MPTKAERLAQLRELRKAGKTRFDDYEVEEAESIYETVDDEGYKKVVRSRLEQDDFVVDDNGEGYMDDGREDWQDERQRYDSESEEDLPKNSKAAKRKREADVERQGKLDKGIRQFFNKNATSATPKAKPVHSAEDDAFLAGLLCEVDSNIPSRPQSHGKTIRSNDRRKIRVLSPPVEEYHGGSKGKLDNANNNHESQELPTITMEVEDSGMQVVVDQQQEDVAIMSDPMPSSPALRAVERKGNSAIKIEKVDEEDSMEIGEVTRSSNINSAIVNIKGSRPASKVARPIYPTPRSSSPVRGLNDDIDMTAINNVTEKLHILSSPAPETATAGKISAKDALEDDGTLRFFWIDYTEVNGSLCLFGKVKNRTDGSFVSCFVKVDNILRKLYFLPRQFRQRHGKDTEEELEKGDVYEEVDKLMTKFKVNMHKIKFCSRKYAFELPGIPREAEYLKLLYPYDKAALPMDIKGETFSHVFGTNTALFEQFVTWKNIMGPCWLNIQNAEFGAVNNASWCKLELQVSNPNNIVVLGDSDNLDVPPLSLMSIALRTTYSQKENKSEILVASVRFYENVSLNDTTPPEKMPSRVFTIMRPHGTYPLGFKSEIEKHRGQIRMEQSEAGLLSVLLAIIGKYDPDAIMGHRLDDVDFSVLLSRMRERKTPGWHRIGRLKRSDWPKNIGKGNASFFVERHLAAGRLLCDLGNDMGKSIMTACQSWTLDEMVKLYLDNSLVRKDIENEKALAMATTRGGLMNYVRLCEADTYFIAAIAIKRQLLPLTRVLTNLAGNSWARTLSGTRAERNEYILLHEFTRNKYICPDKVYGKGPAAKANEDADNVEGEDNTDTKKKDKYKGGLVFEPEKGLYDKFILVMDFNSLYPSIIQEYNICFTTVERGDITDENDRIPDVPNDTTNKGILPRLIRTLVSRRREVKKLMKDKSATEDQLATWDVKQQALKLTANSMYGCLGYTKSRFYARPLAALTTSKGREILQSTKDLAESAHALRVIYGDTDSVMVNTNVDNVQEALRMGREFQKSVNENYELLEIEIDYVFRRLLLHAKKKYAAIKMNQIGDIWKEELDVKGLDMRRREYCQLSKDTSRELLNYLLSGADTETVISQIHEHLRTLGEKMRNNEFPAHKYLIHTQLGKSPSEYPNAGSMPAVQVALKRLARGKPCKAKDVMAFVICKDDASTSDGTSAEHAAKNAFELDEVMAKDSSLSPDIDYYLHKQILPPVERLCAPISGTNVTRLAECLGLDTSKYRLSSASRAADSQQGYEIQSLESQIPDHIRFKSCEPLDLICLSCKQHFEYRGPAHQSSNEAEEHLAPHALLTNNGLTCPRASCRKPMTTLTLAAQLEAQIRKHTAKYYAAWLICDDPACGLRTRQMSVYGHRCLGPKGLAHGCSGRMRLEISERDLYNQLLFWERAFDVEKWLTSKSAPKGPAPVKVEDGSADAAERNRILAGMNRERFGILNGVVKGYLDRSAWGWVSMDSLFGFARSQVGRA